MSDVSDVEYVVATPKRTRGCARKVEEEDADDLQSGGYGTNPTAAGSQGGTNKKRRRPNQVAVAPPKRIRLSAGDISPQTAYPRYREAVDQRRLGFFYIDHRTWVAQICNLETLSGLAGVDGWAIIRSEVDSKGAVRYICTCPDYKSHKKVCVHMLLLCSDDRPPFKMFSSQGKHLLYNVPRY